jgi:hypothetical protein
MGRVLSWHRSYLITFGVKLTFTGRTYDQGPTQATPVKDRRLAAEGCKLNP